MKLRDLVILTGVVWIAPHVPTLYALLVGFAFAVAGLILTFVDGGDE